MGIDQESAVAAIECTDINDVTVAYHLLLDQKQRVMLLGIWFHIFCHYLC